MLDMTEHSGYKDCELSVKKCWISNLASCGAIVLIAQDKERRFQNALKIQQNTQEQLLHIFQFSRHAVGIKLSIQKYGHQEVVCGKFTQRKLKEQV
ncbi:MAG TPA: hypothetical protein VFR24_18655 [Candidatus Angelobacter sp.]|nr:hypothetical protein [Candidatus Angelobacter sp.]